MGSFKDFGLHEEQWVWNEWECVTIKDNNQLSTVSLLPLKYENPHWKSRRPVWGENKPQLQ